MDLSSAYATLGVDSDTPLSEVRSRYRLRAQMLHPDRMGDEGATLKAEAHRAMADLNAAWEAVEAAERNGTRQQATRLEESYTAPPQHSTERLPYEGECDLCGVKPAARIKLRATTGLILLHRVMTANPDLCRRCGISMFREVQSSTLTKGWWGFVAWLVTLWTLSVNLGAVYHHKMDLADPESRDSNVVTPLPPGLPLAAPVFARIGSFLAPVAFVGLIFASGMGEAADSTLTRPGETSNTTTNDDGGGGTEYLPGGVGSCMDATGFDTYCDDPSAVYMIVSEAIYPSDCGYLDVFEDEYGLLYCATTDW